MAAITSLLAMVWILVYAQHDVATGDLKFSVKPSSTEECHYAFTAVAINSTLPNNNQKEE